MLFCDKPPKQVQSRFSLNLIPESSCGCHTESPLHSIYNSIYLFAKLEPHSWSLSQQPGNIQSNKTCDKPTSSSYSCLIVNQLSLDAWLLCLQQAFDRAVQSIDEFYQLFETLPIIHCRIYLSGGATPTEPVGAIIRGSGRSRTLWVLFNPWAIPRPIP